MSSLQADCPLTASQDLFERGLLPRPCLGVHWGAYAGCPGMEQAEARIEQSVHSLSIYLLRTSI